MSSFVKVIINAKYNAKYTGTCIFDIVACVNVHVCNAELKKIIDLAHSEKWAFSNPFFKESINYCKCIFNKWTS